jgi:beta-glucosidase/6-phospho-beta-glucosidase/beta-galactosidase
VASTRHDTFVSLDYQRVRAVGFATVREGLRWHLIDASGHSPDFSTVRPFLAASKAAGVEVIWDLLHFGWPDRLDIFSRDWVTALSDFALSFASLLAAEGILSPFIVPINEVSFWAWAGGDAEYLNPFQMNRGQQLKRQLVSGWVAASKAVRSVLPNATIVSAEPVIHIVGDPQKPGDAEQAEAYRCSMFEAWDMMTGKSQPELGGGESLLDVIGVNFYDRNQWRNFGSTIHRGDPDYRPFSEILVEVYERYKRPVFVSETGTENTNRPAWLAYILQDVRTAMSLGVPVEGVCLYPILNHPGWDDDRHCENGLWDYASETGHREMYQPLGDEIRRQQRSFTD